MENQKTAKKTTDGRSPMSEPQKAKLSAALKSRGLTQYEFAQKFGIHQSRMSQWLNEGTGQPSMTAAYLMERLLDLPPGWLASPGHEPLPEYRTEDDRLLLEICRKLGITPRQATLILAEWAKRPAPEVVVPPPASPGEGHGDGPPDPVPRLTSVTTRKRAPRKGPGG